MANISKFAKAIENGKLTLAESTTRRNWLRQVGIISASGLALTACGDALGDLNEEEEEKKKNNNRTEMMDEAMAAAEEDNTADGVVADAGLLNAALALEHEAIGLYTVAAGLPFMQEAAVAPILGIAGTFLAHHIEHRDALIATIQGMQRDNAGVADPVAALSNDEYAAPFASDLTDVQQVLRLASLKEAGAAKAYLGLISTFKSPSLAQTSGMLGGDEAAHYGALRAALFAVIGDTDITPETVVPAAFASGFSQTF